MKAGRTPPHVWRKTAPKKPAPPPDSSRTARARRLALPGPGVGVDVRLSILPEYLELHHLRPLTPGEVMEIESRTRRRKPSGVLWVKRIHSSESAEESPGPEGKAA